MGTCKPVFCQYKGQYNPQPAYLAIKENGEVDCDYNREINGIPARVFHEVEMWFSIDPRLGWDEVLGLEEKVKPLAEELMAESEVEWNGRNHVRTFTTRGEQVKEKIIQLCASAENTEEDCGADDCEYCNS